VTYSVDAGSTAVAGQSYEALPGTVTIPAGETEATITLAPINDAAVAEDATLTLNLVNGLYALADGSSSATMTIKNLPLPEGWNTWVARTAGLASDAANWSAGHAPLATEQVRFDGRFSNVACEWDRAAPQTVAAWMQAEGYTSAVTFDTTFAAYEATFTNLTITGDVNLESGSWTHKGHKGLAVKTNAYHLAVTVVGDLTLASAATISASGKGANVGGNFWGAAYGGSCGKYSESADSLSVYGEAFGSVTAPTDVGISASADGGYVGDDPVAWAGGAIYLKVGGALTVNGDILCNGQTQKGWNTSTGSGGSIYLVSAH